MPVNPVPVYAFTYIFLPHLCFQSLLQLQFQLQPMVSPMPWVPTLMVGEGVQVLLPIRPPSALLHGLRESPVYLIRH